MNELEEKNDEGSACGGGGGSCCNGPNRWIWIGLVAAVAGVLIARTAGKKPIPNGQPTSAAAEATGTPGDPAPADRQQAIPRLVDLGASKCVPCKMMAPILDELKKTYAGQLDVEFIDVWENPGSGRDYRVQLIPTQIFFDAAGRELFRHEGFLSRDDILAKWRELGVTLRPPTADAAP